MRQVDPRTAAAWELDRAVKSNGDLTPLRIEYTKISSTHPPLCFLSLQLFQLRGYAPHADRSATRMLHASWRGLKVAAVPVCAKCGRDAFMILLATPPT